MTTSETSPDFGSQIGKAKTDREMLEAILAALETIQAGIDQVVAQATGSGWAPAALGIDEAARYLGIHPKTLNYLIRTRKVRYVKVGEQRGRVFRRQDLDLYLEGNLLLTADELLAKRKPKRP